MLTSFSAREITGDASPQETKNSSGKTFYKSGGIESEMVVNEHGEMTRLLFYYKNGNIKSVANYNDGLDGPSIHFFENGDTLLYFYYRNGLPDGRAFCNYSKNKLAYEQFYQNGFKSGTWKYFEEDGSLRREEVYEEGKSAPYKDIDFATNKYYWKNNLAFTVNVQNGISTDTVIADPVGFKALRPGIQATGKALFLQNCASCHNIQKDAVGPRLKGVTKRRKRDWLVKMITNASDLISTGDADAVTLYHKWDKLTHPDFSDKLSSEQVLKIIAYIGSVK